MGLVQIIRRSIGTFFRLAFGSAAHDAVQREALSAPPAKGSQPLMAFSEEVSVAGGISLEQVEEQLGLSPARFMFGFENLGDNSGFGFIQRRCGTESLSLLRFADCPLPSLLRCFRTKFDGFALPENLDVSLTSDENKEMILRDKVYSVNFHTQIYENDPNKEALLSSYIERLEFLERQLIKELTNGSRIFVWNSAMFGGGGGRRIFVV